MGDASPAIAELSCTEPNERDRLLEQDESADCTKAQTWAPVPTAFDSAETITLDTSKDEIPTRPVTPSQTTSKNQDSIANEGDMNCDTDTPSPPSIPPAKFCLLQKQDEETVSAGRSTCAVCGADLTTADCCRRVDHLNQCWSRHCSAIVSNDSDVNRPHEADEPTNVCVLCNKILDDLASIDAFEHRICCLKSQVPLPTVCPKCNIPFAIDGVSQSLVRTAEHLYVCSIHPEEEPFAEVQSHWCTRQNKRRHPGSCAFCSKALADLNTADALYHRRICFERTKPTYCPICSVALPCLSARCTLEDILWHVYNCQHDNKLSTIDKYDHRMLGVQLAGRIRLICSLLGPQITGVSATGPRKYWGQRQHAKSYRSKLAAARENEFGLYLIPSTNLRVIATHTEDDRIMLVKRVRSTKAIWNNLDLFCRSAYCVIKTPTYCKMATRLRGEYETHEVGHEELEISNTSTSCTTSPNSSGEEARRTKSQKSNLFSESSSCRLRLSLAMAAAKRSGVPIPPGFQSDVGEPRRELSN